MRSLTLPIFLLLATTVANAAQIETQTTENGTKTRWSVTNINNDGVMRIDEGGWSSTASTSASAGAAVKVSYSKGAISDSMLYDPGSGEIMSIEGNICRVLSGDSAPPPGMGFSQSSEWQEHQQQMAGAMKNADKQIAEAMKQLQNSGASQAEIDAISNMMKGMNLPGAPQQEDALQVELIDSNAKAGQFRGRQFLIRTASGVEKYRIIMVDVDEIPGGRAAREGMDGMFDVFSDYAQSFGVPIGGGDAMLEIINDPQFSDDYPAVIEDLERGWRTDIVSASDTAAKVDFSPDCEKRSMME